MLWQTGSVRLRGYFAPGQVSSGRVISGWMCLPMSDEDEVRSSQDSQHRVHGGRGRQRVLVGLRGLSIEILGFDLS
jgi:hypothetical protein